MTNAGVEERTVQEIPVAKTDVHRLNPRREVGDLTELAESIRQQGVIVPVLVVRDNGGYSVVHGSRRLAASKVAGRETIPAIVRELSDAEIAEIGLLENLQREDLAPLEVATGYKTYLAEVKGSTVASLAERLSKPESTIRNTLRLLKAPEHIKRELESGNLTAAHVKALLGLADPSLIDKFDIWPDMSVEQIREDVDAMNREWRLQGPEAAATAKKFLEDMKAKFPNATLTWYERGGAVDMEQLLGKPSTKIVDRDSVLHAEKTHDKLCGCLAYAVSAEVVRAARGRAAVETLTFKAERVCIDAKGAKRVDAQRNAGHVAAADNKIKRPVVTAAQREKQRIRREKEKTDAANRALEGTGRYTRSEPRTIDAKLVKGKLDGELARLALFALASKFSSEYVDGWRAQLWRRIAKLRIADVRTRTAAWMARAALYEIGSRKAEEQELKELVLGHFGIEVKAPAKKKAKR